MTSGLLGAGLSVAIGFGVGLSLAAPPGPMNAIIARESARHGAKAGIRCGVAAPIADTVYLALLVFGVQSFFDLSRLIVPAAALGCLLMAYFAWGTARQVESSGPSTEPAPAKFWKVFLLSLSNPFQIAWWLSGGTVLLARQGWAGITGFLLGIFGWVVIFSLLVAGSARRWDSVKPFVQVASADLLFAFSLALAWIGASGLHLVG